MSRRPNTLDQFRDIGGSCFITDDLEVCDESLMLGRPVAGQTGSLASISAVVGSVVTMTGLTGMTGASLGRCIVVSGASTPGNNGIFTITAVFGATTINYENAGAIAPDASNGSISWVEREPHTLEDDLNYARSDRKNIKGTAEFCDDVPTYIRPNAKFTSIPANLTNISGNTLDAHAWIESRAQLEVSVSAGDGYVTITDIGELKHATGTNCLGVPVIDGYDAGNFEAAFSEIVGADGYGPAFGATLFVIAGPNIGERVFGLTRAGASISPDSVEVAFFSSPVDDWDLASITPYTWETGQPTTVNVCYGFRQRLDLFDEASTRRILIKGEIGFGADIRVKVSGNDTTAGFLEEKLSAGTNVTFTTLSEGGNERLEISVPSALPTPTNDCCQILMSLDGLTFTPQNALTSLSSGWLINDDGVLLLAG